MAVAFVAMFPPITTRTSLEWDSWPGFELRTSYALPDLRPNPLGFFCLRLSKDSFVVSEVSGPLCRSCPVTWGGCWLAPKKQVRQRPEKVWNPGPLKDEAVAPASCSIEVAISSSREQSLRGQFNVPAGRVVSSNPLEARLYVCMYVRVLCARL